MNNYEGVFILKASLDNDAQEKQVEEIKGVITKNIGVPGEVQSWGKKKFTFDIKKQSEGFYYCIDFTLDPAAVKKIESIFKLNDQILRVMIINKES
ncbi:MAG: 30S ribosomal protein S6 [Candidatus Omnitrophica bacterium]|nr:30S ribosomal protein S6 [Candidatus Omnitrophota bacterium]